MIWDLGLTTVQKEVEPRDRDGCGITCLLRRSVVFFKQVSLQEAETKQNETKDQSGNSEVRKWQNLQSPHLYFAPFHAVHM